MKYLVERFRELCQKAGGELVVEEDPLVGRVYRCRLSIAEHVEVFRQPTFGSRDVLGVRIGNTSETVEIPRDVPVTMSVIVYNRTRTKFAISGSASFSVDTKARSIELVEDLNLIRIETD